MNTGFGWVLPDQAPSLTSFNHCIVGLMLDARRYWLDPTLYPQGGTLDVLRQSECGWALPLRSGATLEAMPEGGLSDSFTLSDVYELPWGVSEPGVLRRTSIYFGWRADLFRRHLANGLEIFNRDRVKRQAQVFETASELESIRVSDDLDANRIELVEAFNLGRVWRIQSDGRAAFTPAEDFFNGNIPVVSADGRRYPVALGPAMRATHVIEIRSPLSVPPKEWDERLDAPGVHATSKMIAVDIEKKIIRLSRGLTLDRATIEPAELWSLAKLNEALKPKAIVAVRLPVRKGFVYVPGQAKKKSSGIDLRLVWMVIIVIVWLLNLVGHMGEAPQH